MTAETKWTRRAREQGRQAFLDGKRYADCPYTDGAESTAWKETYLTELTKARGFRKRKATPNRDAGPNSVTESH